MSGVETTRLWLKSIYNINKEIDFEREKTKQSLARIEQLEKEKKRIFDIISAIDNPTYKSILYKRYVQGMKWEDIEIDLNYAGQHLHRLHNEAVKEVNKIRME